MGAFFEMNSEMPNSLAWGQAQLFSTKQALEALGVMH